MLRHYAKWSKKQSPYEILELNSKATKKEIKANYYKFSAINHPDKTRHLSENEKMKAHEKYLVIKEAYEFLNSAVQDYPEKIPEIPRGARGAIPRRDDLRREK